MIQQFYPSSFQAPYMVKGIKWVSYDNEESVRKKTQFAYDEVRVRSGFQQCPNPVLLYFT